MRKLPKELKNTGVPATVIALDTEDGLMGFENKVSVGDLYTVYPGHICEVSAYNPEKDISHKKLLVWADAKNSRHEGFVPVECLDWLGKKKDIKRFRTVH